MPNFKKSRGFKMKGYKYPGASPLREDVKQKTKQEPTDQEFDDAIAKADKAVETSQSEVKGMQKDQKKEKNKIDWSGIAGSAIETIVQAGAQAGVQALTKSRARKPRSTTDQGSMGNVQYGGGTNLLGKK